MVHQMIAKCAKELAGAWYENAAHDNQFYSYYPSQQFFIDYEWPLHSDREKDPDGSYEQPKYARGIQAGYLPCLNPDATLPYSTQELQLRPN